MIREWHELRARTTPWIRRGGGAAVIGAVVCLVGMLVDGHRVAVAYLTAYVAVTSIALGALALIMIAQLTAATWFVVLRRPAESVVAVLPALALLAVPILLAVPVLYPWSVGAPGAPPGVEPVHLGNGAYLNVPFYIVRTIAYWAAWVAIGELLRRMSREQDHAPSAERVRRQRVLSAVGLVVFALTVSFAAIDWIMSLTPAWYSTAFGVYFYAGGQVSALALLAVMAKRLRRSPPDSVTVPAESAASPVVNAAHVAALARLLLTFVLFWVYIGYSQLIVIWSGNLPREVSWYLPRLRGEWRWLSALLLAGHFALPFIALLFGGIRRRAGALGALGAWLLVMHYFDAYWLVAPSAGAVTVAGWWLDVGALLLVGGAALATGAWRARGVPLLPAGDPRLVASLSYAGR